MSNAECGCAFICLRVQNEARWILSIESIELSWINALHLDIVPIASRSLDTDVKVTASARIAMNITH